MAKVINIDKMMIMLSLVWCCDSWFCVDGTFVEYLSLTGAEKKGDLVGDVEVIVCWDGDCKWMDDMGSTVDAVVVVSSDSWDGDRVGNEDCKIDGGFVGVELELVLEVPLILGIELLFYC